MIKRASSLRRAALPIHGPVCGFALITFVIGSRSHLSDTAVTALSSYAGLSIRRSTAAIIIPGVQTRLRPKSTTFPT